MGRWRSDLVFDLVLLGFFKSDVVLGKTRLSLPVLKQDESDLPFKEEEEGIERSDLGFWEMRKGESKERGEETRIP